MDNSKAYGLRYSIIGAPNRYNGSIENPNWVKAGQVIAGIQPQARDAIEDVSEKDIVDMTVGELYDFIEENSSELEPFWI